MKKILVLFAAIFLFACGSSDNDGGPCTYVTDTIGATIVRMDSTESPYPDIILHVTKANGELDSIRYTSNSGENPVWDTCTARGWKVGVQLKTRHELRTSGNCDPEYFVVSKEVFK